MALLMKKDFQRLIRIQPIALLLIFVFAFGAQGQMIYGTSIVPMFLVFGLEAEEDKYRTKALINSLPIQRKDMVHAKYVEGIIFSILGYLLALIFQIGMGDFFAKPANGFSWAECLITIGATMFMIAIFHPISLKFGRVAAYIGFSTVFFALIILNSIWVYVLKEPELGMTGLVLFLCVGLIYALSNGLSVRIYQKKDL